MFLFSGQVAKGAVHVSVHTLGRPCTIISVFLCWSFGNTQQLCIKLLSNVYRTYVERPANNCLTSIEHLSSTIEHLSHIDRKSIVHLSSICRTYIEHIPYRPYQSMVALDTIHRWRWELVAALALFASIDPLDSLWPPSTHFPLLL